MAVTKLIIRDAQGNVIYDSDANYASIIDFVTLGLQGADKEKLQCWQEVCVQCCKAVCKKDSGEFSGGGGGPFGQLAPKW